LFPACHRSLLTSRSFFELGLLSSSGVDIPPFASYANGLKCGNRLNGHFAKSPPESGRAGIYQTQPSASFLEIDALIAPPT
jgi:hypothetical protein